MKQSSTLSVAKIRPTHDQISSRAEQLWRDQGSPSHRDEEIWLEAERQLQQESVPALNASGARRTSKNGHGGSTPPLASR